MDDGSPETVIEHLEAALAEAENDETIFHIRQALQHLGGVS